MSLPSPPGAFSQPSDPEAQWWWRMEDAGGDEVEVGEDFAGERFTAQAEAESWVGQVFEDLIAEGVDGVTLFRDADKVYGPMSLHPE